MSRPSLTEAEVQAVRRVFDRGWLGEGAETAAFERALAEFTGAPAAVAVNTGTSALHLALEVLGVGPGDEVIVPSFTFASTPVAVRLCGATPVFVDIDEETLNLDPELVEAHVTPRTRAVMPTDYAGLPADVPAIRRALGDRNIRIIRDAAHAFGTRVAGRPIGLSCGEDATCFSFDPIKNLTCGEGGAVLIRDAGLAEDLRRKKTLGFQADSRTRTPGSPVRVRGVVDVGYRYHMSDINAAIGLAQFGRFPAIAAAKQRVARHYDTRLDGEPGVRRFVRDYAQVVPFIYPVRVGPARRDGLIQWFADRGIHADLRYPPCHQDPLFAGQSRVLPVTERIAAEMLCLPIYADMTVGDVEEVVSVLRTGVHEFGCDPSTG